MTTVLGLLAFVLFIACVVGTAAGITWVVVRLAPPKTSQDNQAKS
ncbi:MAG TPA: hypothetical protein VN770_03915 [Gaiellaceae bacterium]|nr:hypothetical protein [Gaiellaceae bacterium]